MKRFDGVVIRCGGEEVWLAVLDGSVLDGANYNSKGAAVAGAEVEERRRAKRLPVTTET
jgi:hypothetical protein